MLADEPFSTMRSMAKAGKVAFVGGNCHGNPQVPEAGPPVRGRNRPSGLVRPGAPVMEDADRDGVLSIWVTRAYIGWANLIHHSLIKFDKRRLGQVVVKGYGPFY